MSYSVCIACRGMVGCYEKYCPDCVRVHGVTQDETFHKNHPIDSEKWAEEFERDRKSVPPVTPMGNLVRQLTKNEAFMNRFRNPKRNRAERGDK